ncbi:unnamed protein product [Ambrosiozyma monospora]|uniref:Unnamed protein product n=1 Tax=Ambrosiozyma monospora TaxID=43982 RepID=A0ACB5TPY2_AMBMO|nr:unnamed protein product [Ambrosiozyma monospora]
MANIAPILATLMALSPVASNAMMIPKFMKTLPRDITQFPDEPHDDLLCIVLSPLSFCVVLVSKLAQASQIYRKNSVCGISMSSYVLESVILLVYLVMVNNCFPFALLNDIPNHDESVWYPFVYLFGSNIQLTVILLINLATVGLSFGVTKRSEQKLERLRTRVSFSSSRKGKRRFHHHSKAGDFYQDKKASAVDDESSRLLRLGGGDYGSLEESGIHEGKKGKQSITYPIIQGSVNKNYGAVSVFSDDMV